jgi:crotonobetainyl-CoA:carnitine CoA-transferase CaiB-like acyl-CoA transferase
MLDGHVFMLSVMAAQYFADGKPPDRTGVEHPWRVPSKTYRTKDGYITCTATSGSQYPLFCKAIGREDLINAPNFKTNVLRVQNRIQFYALVDPILATKTSAEWDILFTDADLPCGMVQDLGQVFTDPQVLHRDMLKIIDHPKIGKLKMMGNPYKFMNSEAREMTPPPMLGEHTDEILHNILGYGGDKIALLRQEKVVA